MFLDPGKIPCLSLQVEVVDTVESQAQETYWFGRKMIFRREGETELAEVDFRNKVRASSSGRIALVHMSHPVVATIPPLPVLHVLC